MGILEIKNLSLKMGNKLILDNLNLDIWQGYIHAIVGINGAGKSTLCSTIMGLEGYRSTEGDILMDDEPINDMPLDERAKRGITMAWQEPARYEGLSIQKFIQAGQQKPAEDQTVQALRMAGLDPDEYLRRPVDKTLSGGERKKVELASIIAMKPRLVMLDEPDSGIDIESLKRIKEAIQYFKEMGTTILLITHSMEVLSWAEHAFLMCCGSILDKGDPERISRYFKDRCIPCDHKNRPGNEG